MRTTRPILYDRNGEIIGWFEQELTEEQMKILRKSWKEAVKNDFTYRTPIVEDETNPQIPT